MIPKIIHYCWLSDDPMPNEFVRYLDTWRRVLPDYEIRRWDFKRFPKDKSAWVSEAFDRRKYAFAADYIRNYALFTEGGIYLDADVEVLKSFDPLLHLPYFMCYENGSGYVEAAVVGSEQGNPIFGRMLDYYKDRHFVSESGELDTLPLPRVMAHVLSPHYSFKAIDDAEHFDRDAHTISVLPYDFFSPIHIENRRLQTSDRTFAIHRFAGSWQPWTLKCKKAIKKLVGPSATEWFIARKRQIKHLFM